jgi:hypothetical protein
MLRCFPRFFSPCTSKSTIPSLAKASPEPENFPAIAEIKDTPSLAPPVTIQNSATPRSLKSRVVIIGLHAPSNVPYYPSFAAFSADEKIRRLTNRIHQLCENLSKQEQHAMWIIAWREQGITDANTHFISNNSKKLLKIALANLTLQYPQLVIIGGLSSLKEFNGPACQDKIQRVVEHYQNHQALVDKQQDCVLFREWNKHFSQAKTLAAQNKSIARVLRNTVYLFQQGNVSRHDKIFPFAETKDLYDKEYDTLKHSIFEPAKEAKKGCIFEINHPISRQKMTIGVEICFEHAFNLLKQQCQNPVDIQFVLSDATWLKEKNMHARHLVYLDSLSPPEQLYASSEVHDEFEVTFYQNDFFNEKDLSTTFIKRSKVMR